MSNPSTITIHMVASLDGFIAKKDNSISWFDTSDHYEKGISISAEESAAFLKTIDCYVMGSHTYEHALELSKTYGWPYGDIPTIVLTHRNLPVERPHVKLFAGDLRDLIDQQLQPHYKNVWIVGGASLANDCIKTGLANEIRLTVLPILLGDGIPLFNQLRPEQPLHLKNVTPYKNGTVELWYEIKKVSAKPVTQS